MSVSLNQFSDAIARANVRDRDVVTVTKQNNLKLGSSRFRLLRWVTASGIGKRLRNRRTVDAFIHSLQQNFGENVVGKMNLGHLQQLRSRGKPLNVRFVKAYLDNAREVKQYLDVRSEQQGAGRLADAAVRRVEASLTQFTSTESRASTQYPDFFDEPLRDFDRDNYIIDGEDMGRNTDNTVQALRRFCTDKGGAADPQLLGIVQGIVYQRTLGVVLEECVGRLDGGNGGAHYADAPFKGCFPAGADAHKLYRVGKDPDSGKLHLDITHSTPVKIISHAASGQDVILDTERSHYGLQLRIEVDPADYSVKLTRADYQFQFTPAAQGH
ncbi:MAG: hypothetical protein OXE97_07000 [Gammaproteobacteria bacterium]|nr:hypothetical protein [Gammaproteobacteria bacterium]MCY4283460.1 hypothetical protein [Gammaproteobacteria bacterium]